MFQQSNQCPKYTTKTDAATSGCQACVLELALHIARQWSVSIRARDPGEFQQRLCDGTCHRTGDDGSPTHSPRLFRPPAHQPPLLARLRLGKQAHELSSLIGPPSPTPRSRRPPIAPWPEGPRVLCISSPSVALLRSKRRRQPLRRLFWQSHHRAEC